MSDSHTINSTAIVSALHRIQASISSLEAKYQRPDGAVRLIAVSKTKPVAAIQAAFNAGQRDFAENYLDEAVVKIQQLAQLDCCWHFIGTIQSNKTRHVAAHFNWAHCVEREKTARRLSAQRQRNQPPLNICIQVNIDHEDNKSGVHPDDIGALASVIASLPQLKLRGLMAIPRPEQAFNQQRQSFAQMQKLLKTLQIQHPNVDTLSMGMSDDMAAAIAEGTTMVRIGTAIFGARPTRDQSFRHTERTRAPAP